MPCLLKGTSLSEVRACLLSHFSPVQLFVTPWTVACQALLFMGSSRQQYWRGCHALLQGIFPTQALNLCLSHLLHWWVGSLPLAPPGSHPPTPRQEVLGTKTSFLCTLYLPGPRTNMCICVCVNVNVLQALNKLVSPPHTLVFRRLSVFHTYHQMPSHLM